MLAWASLGFILGGETAGSGAAGPISSTLWATSARLISRSDLVLVRLTLEGGESGAVGGMSGLIGVI